MAEYIRFTGPARCVHTDGAPRHAVLRAVCWRRAPAEAHRSGLRAAAGSGGLGAGDYRGESGEAEGHVFSVS